MPTGYTAPVNDGTVTTLKDYALGCARAFGALIELRDEPSSTPIPQKFKRSTYHDKALKDAEADLASLSNLTATERQAKADKANADRLAYWQKSKADQSALKARYDAMLAKAKNWTPPTPDHEDFKNFMVSQLEQSIKFDTGYGEDTPPEPVTADQWYADALKEARRQVKYHTDGRDEEIKRTAERQAWLDALRGALEEGK